MKLVFVTIIGIDQLLSVQEAHLQNHGKFLGNWCICCAGTHLIDPFLLLYASKCLFNSYSFILQFQNTNGETKVQGRQVHIFLHLLFLHLSKTYFNQLGLSYISKATRMIYPLTQWTSTELVGTWLSRSIFSHMFTNGFSFCSYRLSDTIIHISSD